ncbi:MAG: hypothetical protein KJO87_05120, partial [Acidimicrobiia bacterium]|nr:hypothetical protein [Acidimicrobiia bacterium]
AKGDGTVVCWGLNNAGQLGDGTTTDRNSATQVTAMTAAVGIDGGGVHTCVVKSDGTAWCWGKNDKGQLGDGTGSNSLTPVQVAGIGGTGSLTDAAVIGSGLTHACAGRSDGSAACWGLNDKGQLGDNTTTDSDWPVTVVGIGGVGTLADVQFIAGGSKHSCAVQSTGVACWGFNSKGQLGDNTTTDSSSPVAVSGF